MNTPRLHLATLVTAIISMMGFGCADKIQVVDRPPQGMTVKQARSALTESLNDVHDWKSVRELKFTRRELSFKADNVYDRATHPPLEITLTFADLGPLSIRVNKVGKNYARVESGGKRLFLTKAAVRDPDPDWNGSFNSEETARAFANALLVLKEAATTRDAGAEEADFAAVSAAAKSWLAA